MIDKWFKTEQGKLVDIIDHIADQIKAKEDLKIYIGTDSQNAGGVSLYATTIVFRYGIRGCHFISKSIQVPRIKDNYTRLFKEAEFTIGTAILVSNQLPVRFTALEFDYNARLKTESTKVIQAATGWASSLQYTVRVKPADMIACKAADHVVRRDEAHIKHIRKKNKKSKKKNSKR